MATLNRYGLKSATLTFNGKAYDIASMPTGKNFTRDAIDVTALSDSVKQFIPGALTEFDEFTVTIYRAGDTADINESSTPGTLSISVALENGSGSSPSVTVSYNNVIVTKVSHPSIDASGDRKATYDVTFKPDGSVAAA